jgi:hypothetical protein
MTLTLRSLDAMAALDVCDVAIAKLAVTKLLAERGHVDTEAPFLNGYIRPDVVHRLLLRDDLTWTVGKMGQNIQRPIPERKRSTVAQVGPLANQEFKRAEPQLPVNYGAMHAGLPNDGFFRPLCRQMPLSWALPWNGIAISTLDSFWSSDLLHVSSADYADGCAA